MATYERGTVTKISFEITYPDGSTKTSDVDDPSNVKKIVFSDDDVADGDVETFNVSTDDWKQNPSMMLYGKAQPAGIPFCTHNGCKN